MVDMISYTFVLSTAGRVTLPQCLALNYCHITKAGDASRLHELCRRVTELDIAENDFKDWNEVRGDP